MRVLHLLASGGTGGIEILCKNIISMSNNSNVDNYCIFMFAEGDTYDYLKANHKKIYSIKSLSYKDKILYILDFCKNQKIDIVVMHHGGLNCNKIYNQLKKQNSQIKFVRYMHACFDKYSYGNDSNFIKRMLVRANMKKAIINSDKIIYISNAVKESFRRKFKRIDGNREIVIYNGIPDVFFEKKLEKNINKKKRIIFVGRLEKLKGVNLLIDAVKKIKFKEDIKDVVIVGQGSQLNQLKKIVQKNKLDNLIKFVGRQDNVIDWMDNADIFVYPSICQEGFGISVIEAMSRKCIPITFDKGALPEIIDNGVDGFIVKSVKSKELSKSIEYVIRCEGIEKIRQDAFNKSKKFKLKDTILNLEKTYEKIMENN